MRKNYQSWCGINAIGRWKKLWHRLRNKPETHTKSPATQHGCLSSFLGDRFKGSKKVSGENKKYFVLGQIEQPKLKKNLLYRHDKPNKPAEAEEKYLVSGTTSPTNQPREDLFHLYSLSPHSPQFQQSAGATHLVSLELTTNAAWINFHSSGQV